MVKIDDLGSNKLQHKSFDSLAFDFTTIRALQLSTNRYRTLFENANDAIFVYSMQGRMLDVNRVACDLLDYPRKELLKMAPTEIGTPEEAAKLKEHMAKLHANGHIIFETAYRCRDGSVVPIEESSRVIEYDDALAILTIARDIRERKRAEDEQSKLRMQLRQAQKMEALGTLAGGIAHDFNNILSPISGYTELALHRLSSDDKARKNLEKVLKAVERAKDMVQQILAFSRQEEVERHPMYLQTIVKEAIKLLRASLPATIEIRQDIQKCGAVIADPTQIHQVILNLCTNAKHALGEKGGILEVRLVEVEVGPKKFAAELKMPSGPYVRLTISDTGEGMSAKKMERIFEPYYTTKPKGIGTGMGLSVVHGIVKNHGGEIRVYSEPGQGTAFHVYLPRKKDRLVKSIEQQPEHMPRGQEHILVVDDEVMIVDMMKQAMEDLGYSVTAHSNGAEALAAFKANPATYDLLVTDMTMPEMTGDKLASAMRHIRADLPIILCTGFSEQLTQMRAKEMHIKYFLMKPIAITDLARTIRTAIDEKTPAKAPTKR